MKNHTEIILVFLTFVTRFYKIGLEFVHNDAFHIRLWSFEFYNHFINAEFNQMFKIIQPGVLTVWINIFSWKFLNLLQKFNILDVAEGKEYELMLHIFQKAGKEVIVVFLIFVIYVEVKRLLGERIAFLSALLIIFEPFLITNHRIIQTDGLMGLLGLSALLSFIHYLEKFDSKSLLLAGAFLGFAFIEKSTAIILLPFMGLLLIPYNIKFKTLDYKKIITDFIILVEVFALVAVIFFPSYWGAPLYTLKRMTLDVFVLGIQGIEVEETYEATKHIREWNYYLLTLLTRTTLVLKVGIIMTLLSIAKLKNKNIITILILFILYYLLIHQLGTKQIDRYMTTPITILTVIASAGVVYYIDKFKLKFHLVSASIIVLGFINFISLNFHFNQYYDPITKPLIGINKDVYNDLTNLGGYVEAGKYLENKYGAQNVVASSDHQMLYLYYSGKVVPEEVATENNAKYLVNGCKAKEGILEKETDIYFNDICLLTIYKL